MELDFGLLATLLATSSDACILFEDAEPFQTVSINAAALQLFAVSDKRQFDLLLLQGMFDAPLDQQDAPGLNDLIKLAFAGQSSSLRLNLHDSALRLLAVEAEAHGFSLAGQTCVLVKLRDASTAQAGLGNWPEQATNLHELLEKTPIGVVISLDGKVLWTNSSAEGLVDLRQDDELIRAFVVPQESEIIDQALSSQGSLVDYSLQLYGFGGKVRDIYLTSMYVEYQGRQARLDWLTDISELKLTEKALTEARDDAQAADSAKSDFLARMSHEIRTPMNAILGMCYLCLKTHLTVKQRDYLVKIQDAAQMLMNIINDILDFSKTSSDSLALEKAPINLDSLLQGIGSIYAPKAEKKGLEFLIRLDPQLPQVLQGDAMRLSQVLQVLVSNAVKFTEKGDVAVRVDLVDLCEQRAKVHFSVSDSGIGMSQEERGRLFTPFSQADDYTTRRYGGTGLGLAISKSMVELMGGEIWVDSAPGLGSTFHFTLELELEGQSYAPEVDSAEHAGQEILVVDDSSAAATLLAEMLEAMDFKCTTAHSGRQALLVMEQAKAQGRAFRFLFLDWKMDGLDGIETAHLVQSSFTEEEQPIMVLVSAAVPDFSRELLTASGISDFLPKPVSKLMLTSMVRRLLSKEGRKRPVPPKNRSIKGARVLLVEDNEINQEIALSLLQSEGMLVDVAGNGQEALIAVQNRDPGHYHLVFMDIQMPVMDGLQAAAEIRKLGHSKEELPIVAMTAHALSSDREKSLEAGMNDHITKPLDPEKLHQTLDTWIDSDQVSPELAEMAPEAVLQQLSDNLASGAQTEQITGLSLAAGLESVGGNQTLYAKLLRKFRESCHSSDMDIYTAIANEDRELAVRVAHTVKGVSASLGLLALSRVAGTLEKTLKDLKKINKVEPLLLDEFSFELQGGLDAVNLYLGDQGEEAPLVEPILTFAEGSINPDLAAEIISNLLLLMQNLEEDWGSVISLHERIVSLLANQGYRSQVYNLTTAVENFDATQAMHAAKLLEQALLEQSA